MGGSTLLGSGGTIPVVVSAVAPGGNATGFGAGGSGAASGNVSSSAKGGDGAPGIFFMIEFCS
jgi:hypothetical protein